MIYLETLTRVFNHNTVKHDRVYNENVTREVLWGKVQELAIAFCNSVENVDTLRNTFFVSLSRNLMMYEVLDLSIKEEYTKEVRDTLGDIIFIVISTMWKSGHDLETTFNVLHDGDYELYDLSDVRDFTVHDVSGLVSTVYKKLLECGISLDTILMDVCSRKELSS